MKDEKTSSTVVPEKVTGLDEEKDTSVVSKQDPPTRLQGWGSADGVTYRKRRPGIGN